MMESKKDQALKLIDKMGLPFFLIGYLLFKIVKGDILPKIKVIKEDRVDS